MSVFYLSPLTLLVQQFTDIGIILSGGKINTYLAGSSTPQATYTDITGGTPNANPIVLNSAGRLPNVAIWQPQGVAIKAVITDANNNTVVSIDQISGINDLSSVLASFANAASGSGADLVANAVRSYDIFASARAANTPILTAGQTLVVDFEGGNSVGDGLSGLFYWSPSSAAADDSINVIKPTAVSGNGRYLRIFGSTSFTGTFTGFTAGTTGTMKYRITDGIVYVWTESDIVSTSNANTMTMTGLPTPLYPSVDRLCIGFGTQNNSDNIKGVAGILVSSSGTITFFLLQISGAGSNSTLESNSTAFVNANQKGIFKGFTWSYPL